MDTKSRKKIEFHDLPSFLPFTIKHPPPPTNVKEEEEEDFFMDAPVEGSGLAGRKKYIDEDSKEKEKDKGKSKS